MASWGNLTIKFRARDYNPPYRSGGVTRIDLLPDPESPAEKAQIIQQRSTGRKTVEGTLILSSLSDYSSLEVDMLNGQERELICPGESGDSYVIERLGRPDYRKSNLIFVSVSFVEA